MNKAKFQLQQNSIYAFAMVVCLFVFAALSFDFYYDLNDDVMIKDILSGAYTGKPDGHSIQMLYPVSLIISFLYRLIPGLAWMGVFLCACHGICFYLIAKRSLSFVGNIWKKVFLLIVEAVVIITLFIWELVIVQYTITSALLAAAACFLVLTSDIGQDGDWKVFLKQQIVPILLVILAFNVRSEMLLLMSPFIAFSGILRWSEEKKIFDITTLKKYLGLVGIILFGMGISLLADYIAYSGNDWRAFRDFFDARTKVYDYTWYPEYEKAEEFYRGIGATPAKIELIDNYNFGLDESIDAKMLWDIADYAEEMKIEKPFAVQIKEALTAYKWRTLHEDTPYSYMVILAYVLVVALAIGKKDLSFLWKIPMLVVFRTIPWMYVILANRVPNRISHPLYYIELIVLCGWIFNYSRKYQEKGKWIGTLCAGMLVVYALVNIPSAYANARAEMVRRDIANENILAFDEYAEQNPQNYYYMDVYSTVAFSEKMFEDVNSSQKNYDLLGGWVSGSPLQKQATRNYYKDMLSRAELLLLDNFYFVIEDGRDISFLGDFYRTLGIEIEVDVIDSIEGEDTTLVIYEVSGRM